VSEDLVNGVLPNSETEMERRLAEIVDYARAGDFEQTAGI